MTGVLTNVFRGWWVDRSAPASVEPVAVVHVCDTGLGERLARRLAAQLTAAGVPARPTLGGGLAARGLREVRTAVFVVAQLGGRDVRVDLPADLAHLSYAVLSFGIVGQPWFGRAGADLDQRLAGAGATRVLPARFADVDDTAAYDAFASALEGRLGTRAGKPTPSRHVERPGSWVSVLHPACGGFSVDVPRGTTIETGEILAVGGVNPPAEVGRFVREQGVDAAALVQFQGAWVRAYEALSLVELPSNPVGDAQAIVDRAAVLPAKLAPVVAIHDGQVQCLARGRQLFCDGLPQTVWRVRTGVVRPEVGPVLLVGDEAEDGRLLGVLDALCRRGLAEDTTVWMAPPVPDVLGSWWALRQRHGFSRLVVTRSLEDAPVLSTLQNGGTVVFAGSSARWDRLCGTLEDHGVDLDTVERAHRLQWLPPLRRLAPTW